MNRVLRKFISILLAVLLIGGCTIQWNTMIAFAEETGETKRYGDFEYVANGDEVTITNYIGDDEKVIIPNKIEGKSVTSIGEYAFGWCYNLTNISIPSSVKSIGYSTFSWCESLTNISIPSSVTSIGDSAFSNCTSLTSISIPSSVTSIGDGAFSWCWSLTNISIPSSVTSIGGSAFSYCMSLTSINIPSGVTSIGGSAFYWCESLTNISIPSSVTSIGGSAFCDCSSLTSINIDKNNKNYTSVNGVLFNKNKDTIIQYPAGKEGKYIIPSSVTSIGYNAFSRCRSLTSISIPSSVTSIVYNSFYACDSLTSINVDKNNKKYASANGVLFNKNKDTIIQCPARKEGKYIIPSSVTSIKSSAFLNCTSLTSISIPDSVTSIGGAAFYNCSSLTSISIPDGVTSIGDDAFRACSSLTSISIASSVTSIGVCAFEGCSSLIIKGYSNSYAEKYAKENNIEFQALKNLINKSEVSSQTITIGESITIQGLASGGVGPYKYQYSSKNEKDTKWTLLKAYTTENTLKFTPKEVGIYNISIRVMDSIGKVAYKTVRLTVNPKPLVNKSEISSQTITAGSSITIRGLASGGVGPYKYQYSSKNEKDTKWTLLKAYTTENTLKFTPKEVGIYSISIRVMDSTGKIAYKTIQLTVKPKLINASEVSSQTITLGSSITIKGVGSGGIGPYKYQYSSKGEKDTKWKLLKAYTTENTLKFIPKEVGIYNISIRVMDSTGKIAYKTIRLTVNPKPLVNKSEISTQTITLGSSITIKGIGSGGIGPYKYQYSSKGEKDTKWKLLKAYTTENTFKFRPKEVGIYNISIRVMDSTGKIAYKTIRLTVKSN